jgi:hypothetical protein
VIVYSYHRVKKNVFTFDLEVCKKEKLLINILKENVQSITLKLETENDSILKNKLFENILFVNNYQDNIKDFQLCDKIYEIDSIIISAKGDNINSKKYLFVYNCKNEISNYNKSLNDFYNYSVWIRNRLIRKGEIKEREYFEYSELNLIGFKPSKKRESLNAELDSLMLNGLKK